ncbi:LTA synthase family protein [Bdellovibrio sp. HCB-110]|uniref:LTA synthase family protein n=1 Tax=Bdellovibrio sp. HCB-110 TaxID=3391182 RepID=UPI0039B6C372
MKLKLPKKNENLYGLLFLSFLSLGVQSYLFHFILPTKLIFPWALYFSCLLFLRPYFAMVFVFLLECLLLRIHFLKLLYTNSAFESADIFAWRQALYLTSYTDLIIPMIIILLAIVFLRGMSFKKRKLVFLPVFVLLLISCVRQIQSKELDNSIGYVMRLTNVTYVDWNFAVNVKENGILNHLFLTLPVQKIPRGGHSFRYPSNVTNRMGKASPDVFLILCESCYSNATDFVTPIAILEKMGFVYSSLVSPVYGGLTAEAEFEALTGLPSQRFKGVDYQYFAERFSKRALALPRVFHESGYNTNSFHNNIGSFWRRNVVHPRFGFNQSFFIEDMNWHGNINESFPEDDILFKKALEEYKKNLEADKKTFSFLITIHTHGPYREVNDDGGEGDYAAKMKTSVNQFITFHNRVLELAKTKKRPVIFLIFGDHKPAMTISFYKRHIFNDDFFVSVDGEKDSFQFASLNGSQRVIYGRVPLYIKSTGLKNSDLAVRFGEQIKDRPIYCLPGIIGKHVSLNSQFYGYLSEICERLPAELVDKNVIKLVFKEELYGNILFR